MKQSEIEAQERIEVTVCENGVVNVLRPESDRAHSVFVDDGEAIRCSCKGHKFHGHCTHQEEVSRRPLVISSASAASQSKVMTDGGEEECDHINGGDDCVICEIRERHGL